jgi:hypothetical protein
MDLKCVENGGLVSNLDYFPIFVVEILKKLTKSLYKNILSPKRYFNTVPPKCEPACSVV